MGHVRSKVLACMVLLVAPALVASAAVWEGAASAGPAVVHAEELYSVATNSFPRNTVVDITNLENNLTTRVLVVSGLEGTGLLATLSRSAADSIGIHGSSVSRVRITQPADHIAFAHIRRGLLPSLAAAYGDAAAKDEGPAVVATEPSIDEDYDAAILIAEPPVDEDEDAVTYIAEPYADEGEDAVIYIAEPYAGEDEDAVTYIAEPHDDEDTNAVAYIADPYADEGEDAIAYIADPLADEYEDIATYIAEYPNDEDEDTAVYIAEPYVDENEGVVTYVAESHDDEDAVTHVAEKPCVIPPIALPPATGEADVADPHPPTAIAVSEPQIYVPDFRLVPAERRLPPAEERAIPEEYIIPSIEDMRHVAEGAGYPEEGGQDPAARGMARFNAFGGALHDFSPFHVPLVSSLDANAWYVQLGAFRCHVGVEQKISSVEAAHPYPLLVQNIGTDSDPMFRVLLGPLNQGESAAVLRRVRSVGNTDAFVRRG